MAEEMVKKMTENPYEPNTNAFLVWRKSAVLQMTEATKRGKPPVPGG